MAGLGRREEALAAIQEAVTIYRELAAARPDVFRPDLASSLNNLSIRLAGLGRREEALAAIEEAAHIYRELAAARPDVFRPDLAGSLNNLSIRLAGLGRREEALAAIEEAVNIRRELAARCARTPTNKSWNSRCKLLPGLSTAKTSANSTQEPKE